MTRYRLEITPRIYTYEGDIITLGPVLYDVTSDEIGSGYYTGSRTVMGRANLTGGDWPSAQLEFDVRVLTAERQPTIPTPVERPS